jgi:hypothetical protein
MSEQMMSELNKKQRWLIFLLMMGLLLFLGFVFQEFLMANLILPVATVLWLLLRIFVLSVDQQIYWWCLIGLVVLLAIRRVFLRPGTIEPYRPPQSRGVLDEVDHWRTSILSNAHETGEKNTLKRELMWLLTSIYSSRKQGHAQFEIKEAFEHREIPLPEGVYTFLFANEPEAPNQNSFLHPVHTFKRILQSIRLAVRKKMRRWTGREAAEYYRAIDEMLTFMENQLEIKNDKDPIDPHND